MSSSRNKILFSIIIAIAVTVLVPLSFFLIAKYLGKDHIIMPRYYIAERVDSQNVNGVEKYDTIYHQLTDAAFTNQLGDHISLNKDLKGKILVIDFFFTSCSSTCPQLTRNMTMIQKAFRKDPKKETNLEDDVQLISFTVDPERDSFQTLRIYADKFGVNHDHWWFLTGDKKTIYDLARNELGLSVQPGDGNAADFIHTEKIVIVDKDRYVRGYYDGLDTAQIAKCAYDISLLSMENKKKKK